MATGKETLAPASQLGLFSVGRVYSAVMPVWRRSVVGRLPRRGVGCCAPLLTYLRSPPHRRLFCPQSGFLSSATAILAGAIFWRRFAHNNCAAAARWWRSPVEGYSLGLELVDGLGVVVVVVVAAGEAAAWAGTITDLTTGLTQRSGKTSGLSEPPPNAICRMRRRSTVI